MVFLKIKTIFFKVVRKGLKWIIKKYIPEAKILFDKKYQFQLLASNSNNNEIGKFVKLSDRYAISNTVIGDYSYISTNAYISETTIGKYCSIGPNFLCGWGIHPTNGLSTSPMFYSTMKQNGMTLSDIDKIEERKPIKIGNDVFIGANVTVLDGVTIGDGAVIGAGAVVSKDIPAYAIAVGCPVKVIKYRFKEDIVNDLLKIEWWNFKEEELQVVENMFFNINEFIDKYK